MKLETIELGGQKVRQVSCDKCGAKLHVIANDLEPDQIDALLKAPMMRHVCDKFRGHTPGPWWWKDALLIAKGVGGAASVRDVHEWPPGEDHDHTLPDTVRIVQTDSGFYPPRGADALLIAKAPDLLLHTRALRDFVERLLQCTPTQLFVIREQAAKWIAENPEI